MHRMLTLLTAVQVGTNLLQWVVVYACKRWLLHNVPVLAPSMNVWLAGCALHSVVVVAWVSGVWYLHHVKHRETLRYYPVAFVNVVLMVVEALGAFVSMWSFTPSIGQG